MNEEIDFDFIIPLKYNRDGLYLNTLEVFLKF
jgi:hypothetical protein